RGRPLADRPGRRLELPAYFFAQRAWRIEANRAIAQLRSHGIKSGHGFLAFLASVEVQFKIATRDLVQFAIEVQRKKTMGHLATHVRPHHGHRSRSWPA